MSIFWALGIGVVALLVYASRDLVLLLLLSTAVAYLINPLVKTAESVAIRREVAVTSIYLGIGMSLLVTAYFVVPSLRAEATAISGSWPTFTERLDKAIDILQDEIVAEYPAARRLFSGRDARYKRLNAFIEYQTANLPNLVGHLATIVLAGALIPFFSYFLLRDSRKMIHFLMDRLPAVHIETSVAIWCEMERTIGRYLRGVVMDGMVITVMAGTGLWVLGINYPLILGAFSGLTNVVPYLGPLLGGGVAILIALIQFKSLVPLVKVATLYLSIKLLDDVVIQPVTIGHSVHLHPILLLASVIIGGHAFGFIGLTVAVPAVTMLQEITKLILERRRYHAGILTPNPKKAVTLPQYVC
jgi:predicted PurR-regulated permease PerM